MSALPELTDATLTLNDRVAVLTLNRDDVRNALTGTALIDDIERTVSWINATPEVSVLVLTGAGKAFSAGGNIKDMQARSGDFAGDVAELERRYRQGIQRIPLAMLRLEVPAIAAVNGPAIGAGLDLACMCDLRLAAESARFGETFVNLGIIPGDGGAWLLQRVIGYQAAAELTFTGRVIDAREARALRLVLQVLPDGRLMDGALELARTIAGKPPHAVRYSKRLMQKARRMELEDFLDYCAVLQGISHNTADHLEAVTAFLEKRAPEYRGR